MDGEWIPSAEPAPGWWHYLAILLPVPLGLFVESVWILCLGGVLDRIAFNPPSDVVGIVWVWSFGIAIPLLAVLITLHLRQQKILVDETGITASSLILSSRMRWQELRWVSPVVHNRVTLSYYHPGPLFGSWHMIWNLTCRQARAVFRHPKMPTKFLTPDLERWLTRGI